MIVLSTTSDIIRVVTTAAVATDVHVTYVDNTTTTYTPDKQNTAITTATTTTIVSSPAASTQRQIKTLTLVAVGGAQTATLQFYNGATAYQLCPTISLASGESIAYVDCIGWTTIDTNGAIKNAFSIPNGDKGDISVSGGGATWTIDANVVDNTKAAQMATMTLKGNDTASTANPIDLSAARARELLAIYLNGTNTAQLYGHSYFQNAAGTFDQAGRMDAILRNTLRFEASNFKNRAVNGSRATRDTSGGLGGWQAHLFNTQYRTTKTAPYTPIGGVTFFQWGINDLGHYTNTTQQRTAFIHAMRTCISRSRAATVRLNTHASIAYGAGFVSTAGQQNFATTDILRRATGTVNSTITITIPADYAGEKIALCFIGKAGTTGGVASYSGTAGLTGTISTNDIKAVADATMCPVVTRYTAPVTGATQTIIITVTSVGTNFDFDSYWLESLTPPPVIVCNLTRLPLTGQSNYANWMAVPGSTEATRDADVLEWNAALVALKAEFGGMVQIADIDTVINKTAAFYSANAPAQVHLNEWGSGIACQAIIAAINNLTAEGSYGDLNCWSPTAYPNSAVQTAFRVGHQFTTQCAGISATTYTCVAQDMFAIPFRVTKANTRFDLATIEVTNAATAGTTLRFGIYFNKLDEDYPGQLAANEWGTTALGAGAGARTRSMTIELDPDLYWLVVKVDATVVTNPTLRQIFGPSPDMPHFATTGLPIAAASMPVGYKLTGAGTGALPLTFTSGGTLVALAPYIALRGAAPG